MNINIGLTEVMIHSSKTALENLLSDHFILLTKTWCYHWNVKGLSFHSYHTFMEELYRALIEDIDEIAERIRALDERPIGSLAGFLEHNHIKEHCEDQPLPSAADMISILSKDNDTIIREIRKYIESLEKESDDEGTLNFLQDMIERKEKTAWMIRAYLEK